MVDGDGLSHLEETDQLRAVEALGAGLVAVLQVLHSAQCIKDGLPQISNR